MEFSLIAKHFTRATPGAVLGVGDDCALLAPTPGMQLAVSSDMLLEGRHFSPQDSPAGIGHKSLAVNLSDLAAMGATPRWATLAIALPEENDAWLTAFARGFFRLADLHGIELVGGDTTRGALTLSITVMGEVPPGQALRRDGAQAGDDIWVSGVLGSAALALAYRQGRLFMEQVDAARVLPALYLPTPRVALGIALRGIAHSAIDISDGLLADLGHILERSGVGARLEFGALPTLPVVQSYLHEAVARNCVLAGGDDYELCFTAPAGQRDAIQAAAASTNVMVSRIGQITAESGLSVIGTDGQPLTYDKTGYDHFAA
ncbi:MAG TPA: thiamine-phosphate kinase [Thiobacillus sp.]|nr:MAG: thiamine-phosphate kinase [Hydrogenophilales bacterium 28-61-11]OYZ57959.1 MAG: thiamine-phosphate kinase [Hydrogenophilales bacterium 16-61-112]OZA42245.1 MAG: thiamine-phosphate kinase [Hydrogenophilales bacterium 17-61-76]HQT32186.1 thiamine-phosphate kinase [Thiobacillus sp.]HQT71257.1 thiamine-phosphate kinase [Thiobacillus sp.]